MAHGKRKVSNQPGRCLCGLPSAMRFRSASQLALRTTNILLAAMFLAPLSAMPGKLAELPGHVKLTY